jgi:Putative zinc-binding metallo-peptidase
MIVPVPEGALLGSLEGGVKALENKYGIKIQFLTNPEKTEVGKEATKKQYEYACLETADSLGRDRLLGYFLKEWGKYPVEWVKKTGIRSIIFVKDLKVQGQKRYAMPNAEKMALYFDVNYGKFASNQYLRHCIHHEYYHLIEYQFFKDFYYKDPNWMAFNRADFTYGEGGAAAYTNGMAARKKHPVGFPTGYATFGLEEDKAEVFAFLMTTSEYVQLADWQKEDIILSNKIAYMKSFMKGICGEMDDAYFLEIHQ